MAVGWGGGLPNGAACTTGSRFRLPTAAHQLRFLPTAPPLRSYELGAWGPLAAAPRKLLRAAL